ncbi:hypothetical protein PVAP13_J683411 [Panicum virgatum]|nr:hypothetical protein PVAP13_J683411 [Panicum virgatum]
MKKNVVPSSSSPVGERAAQGGGGRRTQGGGSGGSGARIRWWQRAEADPAARAVVERGSGGARRRRSWRRWRRSVGEGARLKGEAAARGCGGGEAAARGREKMEGDREEETCEKKGGKRTRGMEEIQSASREKNGGELLGSVEGPPTCGRRPHREEGGSRSIAEPASGSQPTKGGKEKKTPIHLFRLPSHASGAGGGTAEAGAVLRSSSRRSATASLACTAARRTPHAARRTPPPPRSSSLAPWPDGAPGARPAPNRPATCGRVGAVSPALRQPATATVRLRLAA